MTTSSYQPSYGELAVLGELFEKEIEERVINIPCDEQREGAWIDFVQQYIDNPDTDPHINCLEGVTCLKEARS